ncbi:MAG: hypothetical protein JO321_08550 [Solirubrobacterales bacterium]|nr:hypothetical protein [Solirubrobacterales bacterium]MBV8941327.1 hypothetical protein [Solirubrobacterales bacterium]MBV9167496.1 hypothetical protein [Solirubrobacterales bacterium]MBV9535444.1 hypothetical protein [Solirubrobacterales bacterium]
MTFSATLVEGQVVDTVKHLLADFRGTASAASGVSQAQEALQSAQDELDSQIGALTAAGLLTEPAAIDKLRKLKAA